MIRDNKSFCQIILQKLEPLKWSFTYKQHAWEPPQNHPWKIDVWPLQTEILKINVNLAEKYRKKWK